jgi:membrane protease YdiL (CAAX protease family)
MASDRPADLPARGTPPTPAPRGRPLVAWAVILLAVATAFVGQLVVQRTVEGRKEAAEAVAEIQARTPTGATLYIVAAMVTGFLSLVVVGSALLTVMAILVYLRQVQLRFATGSPNSGIYAEAFAVWIVLFMGLGLVAVVVPTGPNRILVTGMLALSSLAALAWPVFRGVPWRTARQEIGLVWTDRTPTRVVWSEPDDAYASAGPARASEGAGWITPFTRLRVPRPLREVVFGFAGYVGTLPLLLTGILLTFGLMRLYKWVFGDAGDPLGIGPDPAHPIAGFLLNADWWGRVQVILAASVGAPLVEETMFRGVLYRHLREATGRWGRGLSVLASAAVVSFLFAVVHPQGILAVPALMSLAIGFSLLREWRGTLVPSMIGHGLNNLMVTVLLLLIAG